MNPSTYRPLVALFALTLATGCTVSHTSFVPTGPPVPPAPLVLPEVEVNDFAWSPNQVGWVAPGDTVIIEGAITDQGWDPRDGFQFFATSPLVVNVSLDADVPGADLDWCVWDPLVNDYTVCAETEFNPEVGSFIVVPPGDEFHLVVSSYFGTTTYSMTVSFSAYFGAQAADEAQPKAPRVPALERYGDDHRWDSPGPDSPVFSGPLFELPSD